MNILSIITAPRQLNVCYLDQLLESANNDSDDEYYYTNVKIIAGRAREENGYLDKYRGRYPIYEHDNLSMPPHINMNFNYFRALLYNQHADNLMTVEDDVIFTKGWKKKLYNVRQQLPEKSYLLSLYWSGPIEAQQDYIEVPPNVFSCSQGLIFANLPLTDIMTFIYKYGVDNHTNAIDLLLAEYCESHGIPIYVTNPSLVQHIGMIGNDISDKFHVSESFRAE